jgi:crotonobetainyl-CoA:carnitine CoA-transferase CaiB-like acyl-CoA transferase
MFEEVDVNGKTHTIPAITPILSKTPGRTDWPGAEVGAHNDEVLKGILSLSDEDVAALKEQGVC